jgi:rubrerythrin
MSIIRSLVDRYRDSTSVYECRRCGTTLDGPEDACPNCGSTDVAAYEL